MRPDEDDIDDEDYDKLINAEVVLMKGDELQKAIVVCRKRDSDGNLVGKKHSNPILDSRMYELQFPDGHREEYTANLIAENIYSQVDEDGKRHLYIDEISDHRKLGNAVPKDEMWVQKGTNRHMKRTTRGWDLLVTWKDGTSTWEPLKDMKEVYPVQVAEYAVANRIADEPAFAWWVKDVIRKRDRIIAKVKSRYWSRTHKYGIRIPKTVEEALRIDAETGTDFWRKAIEKEMTNIKKAFRFLDDDEQMPIGYKKIPCHMIFDVKMDFTRKARFVAGGHMTDPPNSLTYSSVVSRDSVRLAFLIAALNDLDILACDVGNAYLNADCREKVYTIAGKEFGNRAGQRVVIVKALYGLRTSGSAWGSLLSQTLYDMGYLPSKADPDVWLKPGVKKNLEPYYEYILVYVDDILSISENPQKNIDCLAEAFWLKEDSIGRPKRYLGATIKEFRFKHDPSKVRWAISSDEYVKQAVKEVQRKLEAEGKGLSNKVKTPLPAGYRPELDMSPECNQDQASYYQNLIGVLRWAVELGRIDIYVHVSMLSSALAAPRVGHLQAALHIFAYLKKHERSMIVMDDQMPVFNEKRFAKCDWNDFYPGAKDELPPDMPEPRGKPVQISAFVDADHAGDRLTRRSMSGILIFVNRAPIIWHSKKQNTVEAATFGSEFVALRICTDMIKSLRYKLRMFGVPIEGSASVFCDNQSVVYNATLPESTLKKKHLSIAYHSVRESVAARIIRVAKEDGETNLADMLTKALPEARMRKLGSSVMY